MRRWMEGGIARCMYVPQQLLQLVGTREAHSGARPTAAATRRRAHQQQQRPQQLSQAAKIQNEFINSIRKNVSMLQMIRATTIEDSSCNIVLPSPTSADNDVDPRSPTSAVKWRFFLRIQSLEGRCSELRQCGKTARPRVFSANSSSRHPSAVVTGNKHNAQYNCAGIFVWSDSLKPQASIVITGTAEELLDGLTGWLRNVL